MSVRLVILGLLRQKALYGYEIKQTLERQMDDWTSIAFGSIYFALGKLTEEGLAENVATDQPGARPSRRVYAITDRGKEEFRRLLEAEWDKCRLPNHSFDLGLYFRDALSRKEQLEKLRKRREEIRKTIQYLAIHKKELADIPQVPRHAEWIIDHAERYHRAEAEWLDQLIKEIDYESEETDSPKGERNE